MKRVVSFLALLLIKGIANLLYRFEIGWPNGNPDVDWNRIRLIALLNHTSLLEPLFLGFLPVSFLWRLSAKMVAPGADKTLNRPFVGSLYRLFSPGMVSITRKRDDSWKQFMEAILPDSVIAIIPEGRMKRANGLDLNGNKMTVKSGVVDVLEGLESGDMVLAYSGGLHHVHMPGEKHYRIFKTLKMDLEVFSIPEYKRNFGNDIGSEVWRKKVLEDLQWRLENKVPQ